MNDNNFETKKPTNLFFKIWINNFYRDISCLSKEAERCFMRLMVRYYHTQQPLPDEVEAMMIITGLSAKEWKKVRPELEQFYLIGEGVWRNHGIDKDIKRITRECENQKKLSAAGVAGKKAKAAERLTLVNTGLPPRAGVKS